MKKVFKKLNKGTEKPKKDRKAIPLSVKLDVVKRIDEGQRNKDVMQALHLSSSTISTIYMQKEKILQTAVIAAGGANLTKLTLSRHPIMEKLEKLLLQWIDETTSRQMALNFHVIREKALSLFERLKAQAIEEGDETAKTVNFKGSHGWFDRFKKRGLMHNLQALVEAVSADLAAVSAFPEELNKIIQEGGYTSKQIFNVDETGLFWKRMMSHTSISYDEERAKGHKASKDRLTLLLGGNAEGDVKLKPLLVYCSENPRALKGINKNSLPVIWRSNRSARVTQQVFLDYVQNYFCPFVEKYCRENNLDNKALLIIDSAPGHPGTVADYSSNVQVVFLPPNTSLVQPMDQGVTATFKAQYLRLVMKYLVDGLSMGGRTTVRELWTSYDLKMAVENIAAAWDEVTANTMNAVWQQLLPELVRDLHGLETDKKMICSDIVRLAVKAGFNSIDIEDVHEVLEAHSEDLTDEEMIQREEERLKEETERLKEGRLDKDDEPLKDFRTKELRSLFTMVESACDLVDQHDSDFERARKVKLQMRESVECYRQMYDRKVRETKQTSLLGFRPSAGYAASRPSTSCILRPMEEEEDKEEETAVSHPLIMECEELSHS